MARPLSEQAAAYLGSAAHAARRRAAAMDAGLSDLLRIARPREECGVFGVLGAPNEAAAIAALGLHALQHRGQEAVGITSFDGARFHSERHLGLVGDHFSSRETLDRLAGYAAIGHTRYSTRGDTVLRNVQPLYADLHSGGFAVAHNGNLTNASTLTRRLIENGCIFQSTSDSEIFLQLTARSHHLRLTDRFIDALKQVEGAYALAALSNNMMIGARDPVGIRPLVLGRLGEAHILASETCALDIIGARFVRDIRPGEVVVITEAGVESQQAFPLPEKPRPCIFELIYFARPDSVVEGRSVYATRKRLGEELAREHPANADIVAPVPDSGTPAAIGYAQAAGLPFELGIIRNHYVGRTFIEPTQSVRELGVKRKHSANASVLQGKRVVLVDDSIVRGTTSRKIVRMVREAGASEVHMRIASPPVTHPCYYGIDTPDQEKLIGAQMCVDDIRREIEVESLGFISIDGLYRALGETRRDFEKPAFTDHCFTGDYPTSLTDAEDDRRASRQLSLLAETG